MLHDLRSDEFSDGNPSGCLRGDRAAEAILARVSRMVEPVPERKCGGPADKRQLAWLDVWSTQVAPGHIGAACPIKCNVSGPGDR